MLIRDVGHSLDILTPHIADTKEKIIGIIMKQTQDIDSDFTAWKFSHL